MTIQEFAKLLNGRHYGNELIGIEARIAKELGFVIVFGHSDDVMVLQGAIDDGFGCYGGGIAHVTKYGLIDEYECDCKYYQKARDEAHKIEAVWCGELGYGFTWTYKTELPHETFEIYEDGEKYCVGIVFDIKSLEG